jgi:hypothetical protein
MKQMAGLMCGSGSGIREPNANRCSNYVMPQQQLHCDILAPVRLPFLMKLAQKNVRLRYLNLLRIVKPTCLSSF